MISFRQRIDLSWMGNNYYPPLWWRNKWYRRTFIALFIVTPAAVFWFAVIKAMLPC